MRVFTGSIRRKLLIAVSVILISGIAAVLTIGTTLQVRDSRETILKATSTLSENIAEGFRSELQQSSNRARGYLVQALRGATLDSLIEGDPGIAQLALVDSSSSRATVFAKQGSGSQSVASRNQVFKLGSSDETQARIVELNSERFVELSVPFSKTDAKVDRWMVVWLSVKIFDRLMKTDGVYDRVLFNSTAEKLMSSDLTQGEELVVNSKVPSELVSMAVTSPVTNGQLSLTSPVSGREFIGSFFKAGVGDLVIAVWTSHERILDTPRRIARQSTYLGLAILCLALLFAVFFSDTLVRPVLDLVDASKRIADGDFSARIQPRTRDELNLLGQTFNEMAAGLEERERLKNVFGKFHSKAVFEKMLSEEKLRLGGEKVPVTVFFSDIRSFTNRAERMEPERVVEMLNEYMTEMVSVIEAHGGVVDKYVGDAIMAVWGLPTGDPHRSAEAALSACLEMRVRLKQLNLRRKQRGEPPIEIGMGLTSGPVIAGNIGSASRMEYTVIGDTVNTASRVESLTKDFRTDLLVHESTVKLLTQAKFDVIGPMEARVKGKQGSIQVYGCLAKVIKLPKLPARPLKKAA
jgi:adenylate cyclase